MTSYIVIVGIIALSLSIDAAGNLEVCDFTKQGTLEPGIVTFCKGKLAPGVSTKIICPTAFDKHHFWLFPNDATDRAYVYHYSYEGGNSRKTLKLTELDHIYGCATNNYSTLKLKENIFNLTFTIPKDDLLVKHYSDEFYYFCMSRHANIDDDLFDNLKWYIDKGKSISSPGYSDYVKMQGISNKVMKKGIGIVLMKSLANPMVTHGCGDVPSHFFLNEVNYNEDTKSYTCEVDIRKTPNVGLLCRGYYRPYKCFDILHFKDDKHFFNKHVYETLFKIINKVGSLIYATFKEIPPGMEFYGKAHCVDPNTHEVSATLILKYETEYICNINFIRHYGYLNSVNYCKFKLYPRESVKIIFPSETGDYNEETKTFDDDGTGDEFYGTTLIPKDIKSDCYWKIGESNEPFQHEKLENIFGYETVNVEDSNRSNGEIMVTYNSAFEKDENNDISTVELVYYWRMHYRNKTMEEDVKVSVSITLLPKMLDD
ncbi:hypothetical protein BdWA1_003303 [Babesia duncani]|uniref:6-cysteine protein n=1 Tax=Babesia duncani TaxID=323732 RepID=A0AAD9UNA5_9APIC|nr:hypothetical protein BdWA1_003303 [Babesia duncani]